MLLRLYLHTEGPDPSSKAVALFSPVLYLIFLVSYIEDLVVECLNNQYC